MLIEGDLFNLRVQSSIVLTFWCTNMSHHTWDILKWVNLDLMIQKILTSYNKQGIAVINKNTSSFR